MFLGGNGGRMRMRIGICDDDGGWLEKSREIIQTYMDTNTLPAELYCFENQEELQVYDGEPLDVLFLDIVLGQGNGIEAAESVNQRWKNCQIVYLTNYLYYATEVYQTEHVFFVLKEQFEQRLDEVFHKIFHVMEQRERHLLFSVIGSGEIVLMPQEILYFERRLRVTAIETTKGAYLIREKLEEVSAKLPELDFVRCHNSYIVYFPAVKEFLRDAFLMNDGMKILISRSYSKSAKSAFLRWGSMQR